jgi:ubiquinone/menaquinone biosynthesis C-methylase UbiE
MPGEKDQNQKVIAQFTAQSGLFSSADYSLSSREYIDWAIERLPLTKDDRVLDVAAGTGLMSLAISPFVGSVTALDITEAMLSEGRIQAERLGIDNVTFQTGDAAAIGITEQYDMAMSRLAFHHFLKPETVLAQMILAVKPGGAVVVCDLLSPDDPALCLRYNGLERLRDDSHTTALTEQGFITLFENAGLTNLHTDFRFVVNDLEAWMAMTATPEQTREILRSAMRTELLGGEKTGFSPFADESGKIKFAHRWIMITGYKR